MTRNDRSETRPLNYLHGPIPPTQADTSRWATPSSHPLLIIYSRCRRGWWSEGANIDRSTCKMAPPCRPVAVACHIYTPTITDEVPEGGWVVGGRWSSVVLLENPLLNFRYGCPPFLCQYENLINHLKNGTLPPPPHTPPPHTKSELWTVKIFVFTFRHVLLYNLYISN